METLKSIKKGKWLDPAVLENILWFRRLTPLQKIAYYEKQRKLVRRYKGAALKCLRK